jgi:1-acyl-sn-glycerol-3-phosphate acyltransferase
MSKAVYTLLAKILRVFYVKVRIEGMQEALEKTGSILVANHLGSFGPLALMTSLVHRIYPWVVHEVTELKECAAYIRKDFVEKELKLRSFLAEELARIIGRICVHLMSYLKAIPVYSKHSEIFRTFEISLSYLKAGKTLLIFPENDESKKRDSACLLDTGFMRLAPLLFERTHQVLTFYPVAVNKHVRGVRIGEPIRFNPQAPYGEERMRIKRRLERSISRMYRDLEREKKRGRAGRHLQKIIKTGKRAA